MFEILLSQIIKSLKCSKKNRKFFQILSLKGQCHEILELRRCGGSLVALQTTEAVVPGSNPASLTVENSEDRQSHCAFCKIEAKKR